MWFAGASTATTTMAGEKELFCSTTYAIEVA